MWRHTEESYFASLERAMQNYEKRTGMKDYIEKNVFGITVKEKFRKYLNRKNAS
jgi:3-hydroxy-3-methylglutaryl CoA synthase